MCLIFPSFDGLECQKPAGHLWLLQHTCKAKVSLQVNQQWIPQVSVSYSGICSSVKNLHAPTKFCFQWHLCFGSVLQWDPSELFFWHSHHEKGEIWKKKRRKIKQGKIDYKDLLIKTGCKLVKLRCQHVSVHAPLLPPNPEKRSCKARETFTHTRNAVESAIIIVQLEEIRFSKFTADLFLFWEFTQEYFKWPRSQGVLDIQI